MVQTEDLKRSAAGRSRARIGTSRLVPPVVGGLLLLVALLGLIGTAIRDPRPHDIPVGLAGPAPAVQQVTAAFGSAAPGAFKFTSYSSEAEARAAIDSRAVDGALILGGANPVLIVAGAAGEGVSGVITAAITNALKAQGATATVETVHPFAAGDAHGLILFFVVVAILVSTLVNQALVFGTANDAGFIQRLGVVVAFGVLAGLVAMGTAAWISGGYGSGFWMAVGLAALGSAAAGAVVAGLVRLLGAPGIAISAVVVVILGLVTSGGPAGSRLLPDLYRWLAPWMPADPLYSSLRGALYFDGAGLAGPVAVLATWLVGGVALMWLAQAIGGRLRSIASTAQ